MGLKIPFFISFLVSFGVQAQKMEYQGFPSLVWPKLYNIEFKKQTDGLGEFDKPIFSKDVYALSGKVVTIPGYIVPFETGLKSKRFMVSSLPLNACFFCGVGGPETVVEVIMDKEINYTEKPVQISGILRINDTDPDKMIYTLEKAELLGEIDF